MENFSYHVPFYMASNGVYASGHSSDMPAGQIGLFDRTTWSVATGVGTGKEFFFAQGPIGGKDWYGQPATGTHKSPFFLGSQVSNMYLSLPQKIQNEQWVIGFNGSTSSQTLSYATGVATRVKFFFHGGPIYRFFGGPKEYVVSYTPPENCTPACAEGDCPAAITDCLTHTQALVDLINTHTELQKFGVQAKLVNAPFVAGTANMTSYSLTVCDNGDDLALKQVQSQYPAAYNISRISRAGSLSTYTFCVRNNTSGTLGAVTTTGTNPNIQVTAVAVSTGGTNYRSNPTVTFTGGTGTAATAHAVVTNGVITSVVIDTPGAYSVAPTAAVISAGGDLPAAFTQNAPILQAVCATCPGGTTTVASKDVYYIRRTLEATDNVGTTTQQATYANTVNTAYSAIAADAAFIGVNSGGVVTIRLKIAAGTTVNAIGSDQVELSHTDPAQCIFTAPSAVAWTATGTGIASTRTIRINNVNRTNCSAGDRLADLTAVLTGVKGIQISTLTKIAGVACVDDYTVNQDSIDCLPEDCLTNNVTFNYDDVPAFENSAWNVVPPVITANPARQCGIRISAGFIDPKFGNCSFQVEDYYETQPVKMEVSLLQENGSACDAALWPTVKQTQVGQISRQSGEYIVREVIMKTSAYLKHMDQFSPDPRNREAFAQNLLGMVDRTAFYKLYYVSFPASYGIYANRKNEQEEFTAVFAFKEDDPNALVFEKQVLDALTAKSGVSLHINP